MMFETPVEVKVLESAENGADHDVFHVAWKKAGTA